MNRFKIRINSNKLFFSFQTIVCCLYTMSRMFPQYYLFLYFCIFLSILILFFKYIKYRKNINLIGTKKYILSLELLLIYLSCCGLINTLLYDSYNRIQFIVDFFILLFFLSNAYYISGVVEKEKMIFYAIRFGGILGLLFGMISIINADFTYGIARGVNTGSTIQYTSWYQLFAWPYYLFLIAFYKDKCKKIDYILAFSVTFLYLLLGLVFQKRVIFIEIVLLIIIILIFKKILKISTWINITIGILIFMIIIFTINKYFDLNIKGMIDNIIYRYDEVLSGDQDYDRMVEFKNLFQQYDIVTLILGTGFGSTQIGPGGGNIHIGWLNYFFKGGILLFILHIIIFKKAISVARKADIRIYKFSGICCVYYYCTIFISSAWFPTGITPLIYMLIFITIGYEKENIKSQIVIAN